jgi:plastocyanin
MAHILWMGLLLSFFSQAQGNENKVSPLPRPTREISLILSKEGYFPKSVTVFEGEKVKFFVTSTDETPGCVVVESHKVFLAANKGRVSEGESIFETPGEFAFYCPGSKHDGKIIVLKKTVPKREIASEKKSQAPEVWIPREY